jgi:hypothetical protein
LRAIVLQVQKGQRRFKVDELAPAFQLLTGLDVSDILKHWLEGASALGLSECSPELI